MSGQKMFSDSFKREVVVQVTTGQLTQAEAKRKYGINGHSTILRWIRKFDVPDPHLQRIMDYNKTDKKELVKRIKELERKLEDEQIRSFGYSKMIDIAEEQLKVSIRKKPDTKQSKK